MKWYHDIMKPRKSKPTRSPGRVAEPVQVYLAPPDSERLERLAKRLDATKSDVLRRGLLALESQAGNLAPSKSNSAKLPIFRGKGLQPGVDLDDAAALTDLMDAMDAAR